MLIEILKALIIIFTVLASISDSKTTDHDIGVVVLLGIIAYSIM